MIYRYIPDTDRYGGFDKAEELKNTELPPDRELREGIEAAERGGYDKEKELEDAELPPDREPREED
jgi:hypothetical protein